MGSLSEKVPYPCDNFLLSACQFTASSQGNGKFMECIRLHGADSISQKSPKIYLLTHYFTYLPKFFFANLLFCPFAKVFHYTVQANPSQHYPGLAMYAAVSHISCLISALWLHHIICKGSNTQYALLHSVTETTHKKY